MIASIAGAGLACVLFFVTSVWLFIDRRRLRRSLRVAEIREGVSEAKRLIDRRDIPDFNFNRKRLP